MVARRVLITFLQSLPDVSVTAISADLLLGSVI